MKLMAMAMAVWATTILFPFGAIAMEPTAPEAGTTLATGTVAPDFTRLTAQGQKLSLKQFRGKKVVVLYFYPHDETPNCIKEACGFRNFLNDAHNADTEVIAVSGDSDVSHQAFAAAYYSLPFELISDSDDSLLRLYHVPVFKGSLHKRVTFVIDKRGVITNVIQYTNDGDVHVKEATAALELLERHAAASDAASK